MLTINEYIRANSLEEAYQQLTSTKRKAYIIGGGTWLRLGANRQIFRGIDLSQLSLDYIEENEHCWEIGAMTCLSSLASHQGLGSFANGLIASSVADIVGVQLRNMATIGGTIGGKYGFSDLLTALLALDAKVELFNLGQVSIQEYFDLSSRVKDVIIKVIIPKAVNAAAWQAMRNSRGDFALLNVAVVKGEKGLKIAVGARPQRATLAMDYEDARQIGEKVATSLHFGTNSLASAGYRKQLCSVLVQRAVQEVVNHAD